MPPILSEIWSQVAALKPAFLSKSPHFNFITIHYFYVIGLSILGSICLYIRGGSISYIDSLFLATGASTQSGLNTVDLNKLNTWQQVVLYLVPMMANPITINSFVVFLRLYWFEKRFQNFVQEAKTKRRSHSKTRSQAKVDIQDIGREEKGVNGRSIVVMHETTRPNGMTNDGLLKHDLSRQAEKMAVLNEALSASNTDEASKKTSSNFQDEQNEIQSPGTELSHQPTQIKFADIVKRSDGMKDEPLRSPAQHSIISDRSQDHIAFLQRQRNPEDKAVLRIPGPRDADAGVAPQALDEEEAIQEALSRRESMYSSRRGSADIATISSSDQPEPLPTRRGNITFTEPTRDESADKIEEVQEDARAAFSTLGALRFRTPRIFRGEKLHQSESQSSRRTNTFQTIKAALSKDKEDIMPYLSWQATVGRNSLFVDLTEEQREELGGIEYRSLKSLALILTVYFWGFTVFGAVCLLPWILHSKTYGAIVTGDSQGRVWWAIYTSNSAFTDLGYTLTPDSMSSFQTAIWPLLLMSFLIIIGNTGFPIMLRFIIWVTSLYVPRDSGIWEELQFLLDHPRRCFTLLFPSRATWWLFWILVVLNGLDLFFFIILDLGNTIVTHLPVHIRILDGWFQAVSTRTAGLAVVNLSQLHPAIQVSYLIMMYISVLPIAISVRRTNVYEEKSLGIYAASPLDEEVDEGEPSYVGAHLRRQLSFDLWFIFLGFFVISISEGKRLQSGDPAFTMFSVLFEIVSAYGTVGLSLGYTGINASLSAEFGIIAKLVIIAMQVRGRHRGLPYELDRAILLPSEHLQAKEVKDDEERIRRRTSNLNVATGDGNESTIGRTPTRERGRSKSSHRNPSNFLGTVLHPGPTIPISHRHSTIHRPSTTRTNIGGNESNGPLGFWRIQGEEGAERSGSNGSPRPRNFNLPRVPSQAIVDD